MPEDITPQYFAPDATGNSQEVYKVLIDNLESLQTSQIAVRHSQRVAMSSMALDGMPGVPFEPGTPNPDLFLQGEDIVYDLFLFHDGKPVISDDYDIKILVKTSPRAYTVMWEGLLDAGIYPMSGSVGHYEVCIPATVTEKFFAGTYYLDVAVQERLGAGLGRYDRKYVLLRTCFAVDYGNFSPSPETLALNPAASTRAKVESVWPNATDTIGRRPQTPDSMYLN